MKHICRRVGDAYVVRATPLSIQKILFYHVIKSVIMFLISWLCGSCHWLWFGLLLVCFVFFYLFSFKIYSLTFFIVSIFVSILILLVYSFFFFVFLQKFYLFSTSSFNFNLPNDIFFNLILILLIFWAFY
jgi:hypothetical protein